MSLEGADRKVRAKSRVEGLAVSGFRYLRKFLGTIARKRVLAGKEVNGGADKVQPCSESLQDSVERPGFPVGLPGYAAGARKYVSSIPLSIQGFRAEHDGELLFRGRSCIPL